MSYQIFILLSILGWGLGSFFSKLATNAMNPIMISVIVLITDSILLALGFFVLKFDKTITPMGIWFSILYAIFMTVGTLGFSFALRTGGAAGQTTIITSLYPALTLLLSMLILGETLSLRKGIGIVLALIAFAILA